MPSDTDKLRALVEALTGEVGRLTMNNFSVQIEHLCTQQELAAAMERISHLTTAISAREDKFNTLQAECDMWRSKASGIEFRTVGAKTPKKKESAA